MRAIIQRVTDAHLTINSDTEKQIGQGLVILLGIESADGKQDIEWLCKKICRLRVFDDSDGVMNLSLGDVEGNIMIVSQFTLHASTRKGNRPSYMRAAPPEIAIPLYQDFVAQMKLDVEQPVITGEFGASMQINLTNDGPVTIMIDSKNKE